MWSILRSPGNNDTAHSTQQDSKQEHTTRARPHVTPPTFALFLSPLPLLSTKTTQEICTHTNRGRRSGAVPIFAREARKFSRYLLISAVDFDFFESKVDSLKKKSQAGRQGGQSACSNRDSTPIMSSSTTSTQQLGDGKGTKRSPDQKKHEKGQEQGESGNVDETTGPPPTKTAKLNPSSSSEDKTVSPARPPAAPAAAPAEAAAGGGGAGGVTVAVKAEGAGPTDSEKVEAEALRSLGLAVGTRLEVMWLLEDDDKSVDKVRGQSLGDDYVRSLTAVRWMAFRFVLLGFNWRASCRESRWRAAVETNEQRSPTPANACFYLF